jgi:hypothetical protein
MMSIKSSLWNSSEDYLGTYASLYPHSDVIDEAQVQHMMNVTFRHANMIKMNESDINLPPCDISNEAFAEEFQIALNIFYPTVLLVAAVGNIIVCFIVCSSSRMQTVTNYFITNLGE